MKSAGLVTATALLVGSLMTRPEPPTLEQWQPDDGPDAPVCWETLCTTPLRWYASADDSRRWQEADTYLSYGPCDAGDSGRLSPRLDIAPSTDL